VKGRRLREAMSQRLVHAPGCADPLEAMLIEEAGFDAAYLSGFALAASSLGAPDSASSVSTTSPGRRGGSRPSSTSR
jgi:2-methylisocitrate lyase-like PEP mutase family enzyme